MKLAPTDWRTLVKIFEADGFTQDRISRDRGGIAISWLGASALLKRAGTSVLGNKRFPPSRKADREKNVASPSPVRPAIRPGAPVFAEWSPHSAPLDDDWLTLEVIGGEVPDIRAAALVCRVLRNALMSGYRKAGLEDAIPELARYHDFEGLSDLTLLPDEATRRLRHIAGSDRYTTDLWAALVSDAAITRDGKKVEPTPLCLMFGQGRQHFLPRLASVPQQTRPPRRGSGRHKSEISETECLREALFAPWKRPDATHSFRWDPHEDVRHALRARDPTDSKTKETTQHGANRLAAVGFSVLTVVPERRSGKVRLALLGGGREPDGGPTLDWPIWREPIGLAGIRALLSHPHLDRPETRAALGVVERRRARRISSGKLMNFTRAEARFE